MHFFIGKNNSSGYLALRTIIGVLGMILPFLVLIMAFGFGKELPQFWWSSISATYYTNSREIFCGLMFAVGLFLITYVGYEKIDRIVTTLSGISAFGIAFFPCSLHTVTTETVGIFQLPQSVSVIFHLGFAAAFFLLLAFNSFFLFTRTNKNEGFKNLITKEKRTRNFVYKTCGLIMFIAMIADLILSIVINTTHHDNTAFEQTPIAIILESIMLLAFGFSWLVKGEAISGFIDKIKSQR